MYVSISVQDTLNMMRKRILELEQKLESSEKENGFLKEQLDGSNCSCQRIYPSKG